MVYPPVVTVPLEEAPPAATPTDVETYILVDVDGVLNIGLHDGGSAPILLVNSNLSCARAYQDKHKTNGGPGNVSVDKLVHLASMQPGEGEEEGLTFETFCCQHPQEVSDILVGRLAELVEAARGYGNATAVLSSNWRRPKNKERVKKLEDTISGKLQRPFSFDETTPQCLERTAADRLKCIGDFIAKKVALKQEADSTQRLRFLCLEDFFISGFTGWAVGDTKIDSREAAEEYLRVRGDLDVDVTIIHTYSEFHTSNGTKGKVGSGLTMSHMNEALQWLAAATQKAEEDELKITSAEATFPVSPLNNACQDPVGDTNGDMTPWLMDLPGNIAAGLTMPVQTCVVAG